MYCVNMSCQRLVLVPCSVNLTGKWEYEGHENTIVNRTVILTAAWPMYGFGFCKCR